MGAARRGWPRLLRAFLGNPGSTQRQDVAGDIKESERKGKRLTELQQLLKPSGYGDRYPENRAFLPLLLMLQI